MLCTESLSNVTGHTVLGREVFVTWVFKRNLEEEHQRVRKASKAPDASGHEYRWQRMKFSVLATDVWAVGKENYPKGGMKLCILLEIATSQIGARWNQMCEAWQDTQEMFRLSKGDLGYVPDWLGTNYLDPEVVHPLCTTISASMPELLPNTCCWSVNEAINLGRAPHNTAVESRDKSEWALIYLLPSGYAWSHASYTSCSHYYIYLCAQMLHNQMEFNNSLHVGTHSLEMKKKTAT